jgi:hypothetical protein
MLPLPRLSRFLWIIAPLAAVGFLFWLTTARLERIDHVTNLVETEAVVDPASPTGYTGGLRQLIVPEHNNDSYQWIAQTQQMLARREWRVRHIDYDNAPVGRDVLTPSPYRWWLGLVSVADHWISGRSTGLAVEYAARYAGPWMHALLLLASVAFTAWRFGVLAAGLLSIALVTLFPLGGAFLPGQPDDNGLALLCMIWSVLLPLAGVPQPPSDRGRQSMAGATPWFVAGGVAGGIGLWVDVARTIPVLAGVCLGGILAAWCARRATRSGTPGPEPLPWRPWAVAGALTCLVTYVLEYFPGNWGGLQLHNIHPLHGLAWLGAGELLTRLTVWWQEGISPWRRRSVALMVMAVLAMAAVPVVLVLTGHRDLFTADPAASRLSDLPGGPVGLDPWSWIAHDGLTLTVWATGLPLLLLLPVAFWLLLQSGTDARTRARCALGLGPVLVALGFACFQLRWWNAVDAGLLVLLVALAAAAAKTDSAAGRWAGIGGLLVVLAPGGLLLAEKASANRTDAVSETDVAALIERDLAQWLARHAGPGGANVLAPPNLATSMYFHGGLTVLGTPYWENKEGFYASVRIAGASSPDEAQAIARSRRINYIVVPSWDNFLDEYARLGADQVSHTLMASLHRWLPPRWLQPVPYQLPKVAGFEDQSVAIFELVEVQDNATALSHLAEYFAEMEQTDQARAVAYTLENSFPGDLGAAVSRALATQAAGDVPAFGRALNDVETALVRGDDRTLPWDRSVSLAIALVEGRRFDQAREQAQRCLAEATEPRIRSLTTVALHRLLVMSRGFGLEIADPRLRELARQLLPAEMRNHL